MNYIKFNEVYETNKELDDMFQETFKDPEMVKKNKMELLVEIGELANETRYFKYWSDKPIDMDLVKGEFADCMIMTLFFFHILNINLDEEFREVADYDKVDIFIRLYKLAIDFCESNDKEIIKEMFSIFIKLGYMIGFNDDDIIDACLTKIEKSKKLF
jgi:dimeric dUTPase (all-alpha-NTP-PPase superfamily)